MTSIKKGRRQHRIGVENESSSMLSILKQTETPSLIDSLVVHWNAFQHQSIQQRNRSRNDTKTRGTATTSNGEFSDKILSNSIVKVQQEVNSFFDKEKITISTKQAQEEIQQCLTHFFNCAASAAIGGDYLLKETEDEEDSEMQTATPTTSSKLAVDNILQLTAAISATSTVTSLESCMDVLQYVENISRTPKLDTFRSISCQWIGYLVNHILDAQNNNPRSSGNDIEGNIDSINSSIKYNDILDAASQALLPRFTDKSQSVRMAAIYAGANFFQQNGTVITTDPDILQAMIWSLQHDPSPVNRFVSCTVIPINLETVDYLISRIRDLKPKIRCAALQRLHSAFSPSSSLLEPPQATACLMAGWTNRCTATKNATRKMVCLGWMKEFRYNPLELITQLNVIKNHTGCEIVVEAIQEGVLEAHQVCDVVTMLQEDLNDSELRIFKHGIKLATAAIANAYNNSDDFSSFTAEQLFLANTMLKISRDQTINESLLAKIVTDIPTLCANLEDRAKSLIEYIQKKDESNEDITAFYCLQLLRLASYHQSTTKEEGSRRVFSAAIKSMLSNILTPDHLIEGAVDALRLFVDNDSQPFIDHVAAIVHEVNRTSAEKPELLANCKLRILSVLSIALEKVRPSEIVNQEVVIQKFSEFIIDNIRLDNIGPGAALVQEAAVFCYGKLGLLRDPSIVKDEFIPTLLDASKYCCSASISTQSLLALCDYSLLTKVIDPQVISLTTKLMSHSSVPVSCIASEVACKLLLYGLVDDSVNSIWLARLLIRFFEQTENIDEDFDSFGDYLERGNPIRLQQLLILFFPALCIQSQEGQDALMGAIEPMLDLIVHGVNSKYADECYEPNSKKRGRKTRTQPFAKIIEYICTQVRIGEASLAQQKHGCADPSEERDEDVPESSPELIASIQIVDFLSRNLDNIETATLRVLCKILGNFEFNEDKEACEHLHVLKEAMEDLSMVLDDDTATKHLLKLNSFLTRLVIVDDREVEDDSEE